MREILLTLALLAITPGCDVFPFPGGGGASDDDDDDDPVEDGERLTEVEAELLELINDERAAEGLPELQRDPGMETIEYWYTLQMLAAHDLMHHIDPNGRNSEARARYYGDDPDIRCSEIIQWWGGDPSGAVHYEHYQASPDHHMAYMEEGGFNLGPTSFAGVAAVAGLGPTGTEFEDRWGSYSGVMFCEGPVTIVIDPFSED
jgi:hypothetical protein